MFKFSEKSYAAMKGVDPRLVAVATLALSRSPIDFVVTEGLRSIERQNKLLAEGKSKTIKSKHLIGHAIDIAPIINGKVSWDFSEFEKVAVIMKRAALDLDIPLFWGGDWKSFKDGPHFQIET